MCPSVNYDVTLIIKCWRNKSESTFYECNGAICQSAGSATSLFAVKVGK